jgi:coproporphyrinogen III oxidase
MTLPHPIEDDHQPLAEKKELASAWFANLRDEICASYEAIEREMGSEAAFQRTPWEKSPEDMLQGTGVVSLMKGEVFEKVGVNISVVYGEFSEKFRKEIPGAESDPNFWAAGVSLVAHPKSPLVPAAHFNTRMIAVGDGVRLWFGGGGDLNPMIEDDNDTRDFHAAFEAACDAYNPAFYPAFRDWCKEYFYIPHRGRERGVGGIFYDYLGLHSLGEETSPIDPSQFGKGGVGKEKTRAGMQLASDAALDWHESFAFTRRVGEAFRDIYPELVRRQMNKEWTAEQREIQLIKRGHYAEYNLLYDRGTRFGLMTGGNPEAILMSLPPVAKWD